MRNPEAVGAWLHGVAVRIATRAKRTAARRRRREERASGPEADRPIPEAAWSQLLAAVHEEVQLLPESLRTAFVMCDLEGVRQPDAAARLGWKPGTLTGRLTRARQLIVERLTTRGLAPAFAGGGLALGQATASAVVPGPLFETALNLARAGGSVPAAVLNLAKGASPMMAMRSKLLAFSMVFAGGLGAVLYPMAAAQPPGAGAGGLPPPGAGTTGGPAFGPMGGSAPGGAGVGGMGMLPPSRLQWEYKFVPAPKDYDKSFLDLGNDGWEYCGLTPTGSMLVFKRQKNATPPRGMSGSGAFGGGSGFGAPPGGSGLGMPPGVGGSSEGGGGLSAPMIGGGGGAPMPPAQKITVIPVKHGLAIELSVVLERVFKKNATVTADPRTNSLIIDASANTLEEVKALIEKLDAPVKP